MNCGWLIDAEVGDGYRDQLVAAIRDQGGSKRANISVTSRVSRQLRRSSSALSELVKGEVNPLWLDGMYVCKGITFSFFLCERDLMIMSHGTGTPGDYWLACNQAECSRLLGRRHEIRRIH